MRILLLTDAYLPGTTSGAKLTHSLAEELAAQGHDVVVAAPDDTLEARRSIAKEGRVTVLRARTGRIKGAGKAMRAFNEWRLPSVLWNAGRDLFRERPCDLIAFYSPTIFFGPLVKRLKRLWRCPAVLILRDIFPQWAVDAGVLTRGGLPWRFFRSKELQQYAAADVICVQSAADLRYFQNEGWAERYRLEVLLNWTRTEGEPIQPLGLRKRLGLEGKTVFFYGGNMGVAQDMDNILRLAAGLRARRDIFFLLMGNGSEAGRLRGLVKSGPLDNVAVEPAVEQQAYLGAVSEFDVGVLSLDRRLRTQNYPGKMLGYMYLALPILASINPGNDLKECLEAGQAGLVCFNGDDASFLRNALALADDRPLRERMGRNARKLLEQRFDVRRAAAQLIEYGRQCDC